MRFGVVKYLVAFVAVLELGALSGYVKVNLAKLRVQRRMGFTVRGLGRSQHKPQLSPDAFGGSPASTSVQGSKSTKP